MKAFPWTACCAALFFSIALAEPTDGEPSPSISFPAEFKDYQLLPDTVSPDQRYGFIFPKRSVLLGGESSPRLLLVSVKPFKVLEHFDIGNSGLILGHGGYHTAWSADRLTVIFNATQKWGAEKVWVTRLQNENIVSNNDLTAAVRRAVQARFKKSGAARYNDHYDFVFEDVDASGWQLDNHGHVLVNTICTTDPKEIAEHRWAVRFTGTWDINKQTFIQQKLSKVRP